MATERIITPERTGPEEASGRALRPVRMADFVGQAEVVERLSITLAAAASRGDAMEHTLLHGPPGLGKTTLAYVIAAEMGASAHVTSGPALTRGADLVGALTRLEANDVLFIDEIHRMPPAVEEFIYPAMEDFRIDVPVDAGAHSRTVSIGLKPFTLLGATTRAGMISAPLRSRFGVTHHLRLYTPQELFSIVERSAGLLGLPVSAPSALRLVASRSRGAPRIANRLLRRVRDYAQVRGGGDLTPQIVEEALALEGVDSRGLDGLDRKYLRTVRTTYAGGPVGVEAIAATMGEDSLTLEDVVEPYLLQEGLVARTKRGRELTAEGSSLAAGHLVC